jgi:hypothetical protein
MIIRISKSKLHTQFSYKMKIELINISTRLLLATSTLIMNNKIFLIKRNQLLIKIINNKANMSKIKKTKRAIIF